MSDFHALTIQDITRETDKAVSITFGVPSQLKEQFSFKAGQYITLKTQIDGKEVRRALVLILDLRKPVLSLYKRLIAS